MTTVLPVPGDSFTRYLAEIRKFPLLEEQEEHELAVQLFENNDLDAAQKLITSNLRFVVKVATEYKNYGMKMLDLVQEGNIGLMLAVRKFNPYRGFRLITYAVWWIKAQIQNYIMSNWSLLKIGTTQAQRKLFFKLRQARQAISQMSGTEEFLPELADRLDVSEEVAGEMELRLRGEVSLDAEYGADGDGGALLDSIADDRPNQEAVLSRLEEERQAQQLVADAVSQLTEKEQAVVAMRLTSDEPLTLQQIADKLLISRERVRQIEENALKKIKRFLEPRLQTAVA